MRPSLLLSCCSELFVCIAAVFVQRDSAVIFKNRTVGILLPVCTDIVPVSYTHLDVYKRQQSVIGAVIVLAVEFISGCVLNLWLGLGVWDYSNQPGNVLGQIK